MPEFTATYGYAPISSQPLKIHNYETAQISIDEIRLSNDKFELNVTPGSSLTGNPNAIIPPDGNSTTITIKPKDGLDAGSHTATVTISYIDPDDSTGKTKVPIPIDVTFTVEKANQDPPTDTELKVEKFTHNSATLIPLSGTDEGKTIEYGYTDDDGKEGNGKPAQKLPVCLQVPAMYSMHVMQVMQITILLTAFPHQKSLLIRLLTLIIRKEN